MSNNVLHSIIAITSERDRELLEQTLVTTLSELVNCERITMYRILMTDDGKEAMPIMQDGRHPDNTLENINISARTDFSLVCNTGKEYIQNLDGKTSLSVYPILGRHGIIGLLEIISNNLGDFERHLISSFLKVYSNYLIILDESETDTLTGLLNRRTFDVNLEKIIAERTASDDEINDVRQHPLRRKENDDLPHWMAVMDIDHFKQVNDKFGHLYGDEVLLLLSRQMKKVFRQRDKLFRFGGEEFVVVLDRATKGNARNVLERFRSTIEDFHFPQVGKVTISIGFVRLDKADVPSSIVGHADQALYYAKEHGRNQVCSYEDLVSQGNLEGEHYSDDIELF